MPLFFAFSMGLIFLLASCGEPSRKEEKTGAPPFPAIEKAKLLVIHHDRDGSLIHYLALEKVSDEMLITVKPTRDDQDVYVTVLGTERHALLKRDFTVFSKAGEGNLGQIDVFVEKGKAISINGNGINSPALVSDETLRRIDARLTGAKNSSEGTSTIKIGQEGVE